MPNTLINFPRKKITSKIFHNKINFNIKRIEHSFHINQNSIFTSHNKNKIKNFNRDNLLKIQNKTFLGKYYKGYFQSLVMQNIEREPEYVEVQEPIIFEKKKFTILDIDPTKPDKITKNFLYVMYPIIGLTGYKLGLALYSFAFFRSLFWTVILFYALRIRLGIISNQEHIICEIRVFENGKTCEISTIKKTFTVDINKIRRISLEEAMYMSKKLESIKISYIPIVIETSIYLVPIRSRIHRKDFLGSISDGKYLKFEEVIHKDNSIHV